MTAHDGPQGPTPFGISLTGEEDRIWKHTSPEEALEAAKQREQDMRRWVARHGSDGLKEALAAGYDVVGRYARERAAQEYPGFTVASEHALDISDRANPTDAALRALRAADARVRELEDDYQTGLGYAKKDPKRGGREPALEYVSGEVVFIEGYLGGYLLVKPTDSRRPLLRFTRRLFALIAAGTALGQALRILEGEEEDVRMRSVVSQLRERMPENGSLAEAMEAVDEEVFSPFYIELVRRAEELARLEDTDWNIASENQRRQELGPLRRLVEDLEAQDAARR